MATHQFCPMHHRFSDSPPNVASAGISPRVSASPRPSLRAFVPSCLFPTLKVRTMLGYARRAKLFPKNPRILRRTQALSRSAITIGMSRKKAQRAQKGGQRNTGSKLPATRIGKRSVSRVHPLPKPSMRIGFRPFFRVPFSGSGRSRPRAGRPPVPRWSLPRRAARKACSEASLCVGLGSLPWLQERAAVEPEQRESHDSPTHVPVYRCPSSKSGSCGWTIGTPSDLAMSSIVNAWRLGLQTGPRWTRRVSSTIFGDPRTHPSGAAP
jgi:hypothetical protein